MLTYTGGHQPHTPRLQEWQGEGIVRDAGGGDRGGPRRQAGGERQMGKDGQIEGQEERALQVS
jgi:hypothetical protein